MSGNVENVRPFFSGSKTIQTKSIEIYKDVFLNKYISQYIKPYQIDGVKFLYKAYVNNRGCILADDMGLGKTIQVIAFIAAVLKKTGLEEDLLNTSLGCIRKQKNLSEAKENLKFLIVCPATLIDNWIKEFNIWGYFGYTKYHGTETDRNDALKKFENNRCEIVITTHETCSRHIDRLKNLRFAAVIVDEFHKMKNDQSGLAKNLRQFLTLVRMGLSGTIIQNGTIELWSLVDWVCPDALGSKIEFKHVITKPIQKGHRQNASKRDLNNYSDSIVKLEHINKDILLRRTKDIISDQLPQKTDQIIYCKLSDFQVKIYKKMIESADFQYLNTKCDECPCKRFNLKKKDCCFEELKMREKNMMFAFIHIFLKIANHPALLVSDPCSSPISIEYIKRNLPEILHESVRKDFNNPDNCGKLKILIKLLEAVYNQKSKVLLFSYSVKLLDIIQNIVSEKRYYFVRLDGNTKNKDRQAIVDDFNQNPDIFLFLISTKAGGVGLNITSANVVIIFDPNWNPAHDLQAQDRAYRLGQLRDVHVYRLISSGCLEENIYLRQIYKMHLNKECVEHEQTKRFFQLSANTKKGELFGIKNLFSLNLDRNECLTLEILKRYTKIEKGIAGIDVSEFVSPTNVNSSLEQVEASENEDSEDTHDEDDSFETEINKVLKNNDVIHTHSNKDLIKSSKIELHLRTVTKGQNDSNQYAFDCNIRPDLSTLDYIEIEQDDYEIDQNKKIVLKNGSIFQYGNVPDDIKKEQFKKMAELLNCTTSELSKIVLQLTKEQRFSKLKQFYIKTIPESVEFYASFSKNPKRKSSNSNEFITNKKLKQEDEFENNETLKDVFDLIQEDEEQLDSRISITDRMNEDLNLYVTNSNKISTPDEKEKSRKYYDKYDKLFDELFKD